MLATRVTCKGTVLVVDDSPEMLRYFRFMLELDCYRVETVGNGLEALQKLSDGCNPDAVVLDLQMPNLDGLCTLKRLLKVRPGLKVVMCSGVSDPIKAQQATALGAEAYLVKPVHRAYLNAALERCMKPGIDSKAARSAH
jgi:two-component system, cell cycle sensor histidine kinase and response regulator CckA